MQASCSHLGQIHDVPPNTAGCEECLKMGDSSQGSRLACGLASPKEEHPPRDVCYRSFGRTPNTITGRVNNGTELTATDSTHQAGKEPGAADQSGRAGGAGGVGASGRRVGEGRPGSERSAV